MNRAPGPAALEALAVYLAAELPTYTVLRGWPESDVAMNLSAPVVAITQTGRATETAISADTLGDVAVGEVKVRTGALSVPIQIDVFAGSREGLDAASEALDVALHNDLPYRPHLYLTATDHHAQPFVVLLDGDGPDFDGDSASTGEYRATWTLRAEIERIVTAEMPEAVTITITETVT